jgi:hypothetical protein
LVISPNDNIEAVLRRMDDLEKRVRELRNEARESETREWRFWERWGPVIYMAMGAALAIALGAPSAVKSLGEGEANARLEPQEYVLRDGTGHVRAKLIISDDIPQLTLYDNKGYPATALTTTPSGRELTAERPSASANPSTAPAARPRNADGINSSKQPAERSPGSATSASGSLARLTRFIQETFSDGAAPASGSGVSTPLPAPRSMQAAHATPRRVALTLSGPKPAAARPMLADMFRPGSVPSIHLEALPLTGPPAGGPLADSPLASVPASPARVTPLVPASDLAPSANAAPALPAPAPGVVSLTAPPAPPSVKLTVLGYVEKPGVGREVLISQNSEVYVTHEGATFADRFKVLRITPTLVEVLDTYTHQSLQLTVGP